jgi:hypothetical protein
VVFFVERQEQHNYHGAQLKLFEDKRLNKVWVYPKQGGKPYPLPVGKCTMEVNFQPLELEHSQGKVETAASWALRSVSPWTQAEYDKLIPWPALHIIRNTKSRRELFTSPEDWNARFTAELAKETEFSKYFHRVKHRQCEAGRFLVTSDVPIVEFWADLPDGNKDLVRCFAKSPEILILLWGGDQSKPPEFPIPIEDLFNALMWANVDKFLYSHRGDVQIDKLRATAEEYDMIPVAETIGFYSDGSSRNA